MRVLVLDAEMFVLCVLLVLWNQDLQFGKDGVSFDDKTIECIEGGARVSYVSI